MTATTHHKIRQAELKARRRERRIERECRSGEVVMNSRRRRIFRQTPERIGRAS